MRPNLLKRLVCACLLTSQLLISSTVFGRSGGGAIAGGGGDATEERVDEIRSDLLKWINDGGAKDLILPETLSYEEYVEKMTHILQPQQVVVGFVEKDDDSNVELQVNVSGMPKTCRGFLSILDSRPHILCNISRFKNTTDSEQYKLIHHEYAGLMNIESNDEAASDYKVSSQITDYLTLQTVLRLAVKTKPRDESSEELEMIMTKNKYLGNQKFEVEFTLSNSENVLQVSLENSDKKTTKMPKVILNKKNNFSFSRIIDTASYDSVNHWDISYPNVVIQFTDGTLEVLSRIEYLAPRNLFDHNSFYGFGEREIEGIIKAKILGSELSMKPSFREDNRKPIMVKNYKIKYEISFNSSAIDLSPYSGVIITSNNNENTELLSDDPRELASFIDSQKIKKEILFIQRIKESFLVWRSPINDYYQIRADDSSGVNAFTIKFIKKDNLLDYKIGILRISDDDPKRI